MSPKAPALHWEYGTAYELFVSLWVLHKAEEFGIRPSFAAGVRSRIPAPERKLLEDLIPTFGLPFKWLHGLPAPRDAITALWALKQIPAAERMIRLTQSDEKSGAHKGDADHAEKVQQSREILLRVSADRKWKPKDLEFLLQYADKKNDSLKREVIERILNWWSRPEELGELMLSALQAYYQSFFEEEEKRIEPVLKRSLEHAKKLASKMNVDELFLELSQGIKLDDEFRAPNLVFAPAFWSTPLILFDRIDRDTMLILFGARPVDMSVVPGEMVPDGLVRALKALADPTRLKILNYLSREELSPSELARRLKLRAPTVTHHMSDLRLAGLVNVIIQGQEKRYTARTEAIDGIHNTLKDFLNNSNE